MSKKQSQPSQAQELGLAQSDYDFFHGLKHYKPLFYSGKGAPILMTNDGWTGSFYCAACTDVIAVAVLVVFIINMEKNLAKFQNQGLSPALVIIIAIGAFMLTHVFLFLTQFLNPGIINQSTLISKEDVSRSDLKICDLCCNYKTKDMVHCKECEVCIWGSDHHCGFFNKCIGGYQKWAFYACLLLGFLSFVVLIMLAGCLLL